MPGVFLLTPGPVFQDPNQQAIHANATITSSSSMVVSGYGVAEVTLFINVKASPTGSSPTLQYTIQEVDPGDGTTVIGAIVTSTVINAIGIQRITLESTFGGSIRVSWTVGGGSPSFTQVYATLVGKAASVKLVDPTGVPIDSSNPLRVDLTGTTTQPVSGTVTAEQATAANLNATVTQGPAAPLSGYWTVRVTDGTNTMPTGDVVGRAVYHLLTDGTNTAAVTGAGALKVDGSAVTQPVSGTVTSNQGPGTGAAAPWSVELSDGATFYTGAKTDQFPSSLIGGRLDTNTGAWLGSTAPTVGQKTSANSIPIVIASDQSPIPVTVSAGTDRTSTGAITSTQDVAVSTQASGTCGVQVTGTWTGTLVFEATVDAGTTWNPVNAEVPTTGAEVTSTTANGVWVIACAGYEQVRVRGNSVSSGSATVYLTSSTATQVVILGDPLPAGTNNIGDVDVLTVPAPLSTTGGGTEATALRVTIANDSTGLVSVDDNGGSLTVDTPQLPGALVGGRLDTNTGAWLGSTAPTVGQKTSANSIPIVVASDQSRLPVASEVQLDYDSSAGTQNLSIVGLALPASGGAVAGGTTANPIRTDPTGTTTQPVSDGGGSLTVDGTVTADQGAPAAATAPWAVRASDGSVFISVALEHITAGSPHSVRLTDGTAFYDAAKTGQFPAALVGGRLDANVGAWLGSTAPTVGQKTMAASIPIVIASDQSAVPVSQSGTWTVQQGTPPWSVVGPGASGAALSGNPVRIAGSDGTNTRDVLTDASGRQVVIGASAVGAAVAGNPVLVGGSDGTNAQYFSVDTSGRVVVVQPTPSLLNATVTQGPAAALSGYWPVRVTDGTNTFPTADVAARKAFFALTDGTNTTAVKAASTAASATDPSAVVALSPNTPLPAGTNTLGKVDQGAAAALSGAWPVKVTDGTNTLPTGDAVGRAIFEKITDGTNTAGVDAQNHLFVAGKSATGVAPTGNPVSISGVDPGGLKRIPLTDTDGTLVITPRDDLGNIGSFGFGGDHRLRVGQESLLFFDTFEGGTINNVLWMPSTSGMAQVQASSFITLNNGNSTTSGDYSIFTSTKSFFLTSEFPIYAQFKARLIPQTNAVLELGFGNVATTAAPTDGCFLRVDSAGNMRAVINYGGTETISATLGTLTSANYYSFEVFIYEDSIRVDIDNADGSDFASVEVPIPATQPAPMTVSHVPVFARVYNSGTPGTAANILLSGISVQQLDLAMTVPWEEQMAGTGRGATANPLTGSQLANFSNSTAPSTITTGTLSNTTAAYTTLGGLFAFNTPAGAETDYLLFAYQVPNGFTAYIWTVQIGCVILGAQSSTSPTVLQWGIAVGSSAASLATGSPNPPMRQAVGFQQAPKTASVGDTFSPPNLTYSPKVPLVCFGGKYIQIIVRVVSGNATVGQINRGFVNIDGFLQ